MIDRVSAVKWASRALKRPASKIADTSGSALAASALPLVSAIFEAGRFNARDAHFTALTLSIIALGLPAYVLVKVLTPGFYARRDTATPVKVAIGVLIVNVILN